MDYSLLLYLLAFCVGVIVGGIGVVYVLNHMVVGPRF